MLISATLKTYPATTLSFFLLEYNSTEVEAATHDNSNFYNVTVDLLMQLPAMSEAGLMGYMYILPINGVGGYTPTSAQASGPTQQRFIFLGWAVNEPKPTVDNAFAPILKKINSMPNELTVTYVSYAGLTMTELTQILGTEQVGVNVILASRLWDKKALSDATSLTAVLRKFQHHGLNGIFASGPGVRSVPVDAASVTPAWRSTYLHIGKSDTFSTTESCTIPPPGLWTCFFLIHVCNY